MWLLVVIALVALVAIIASAQGRVWGPLLVGLGFAGWGALLLLSGYRSPWPETGLLYFGGSVAEFAAATEFWSWRCTKKGPPLEWKVMATLLGVAGSVLLVFLPLLIAGSIASSYGHL